MDTIIALSSGALPAGVAVVRASGPSAEQLVRRFCRTLPAPRVATLCVIRDEDGAEIDRGLVLWFPGDASFTGEPVAEFHLHGGRAVVDRFLFVATATDGVRLAEAGEFARRAFANGKLDLTQAEGLADLIDAETEAQRRFAVSQAGGAHRDLYQGWRERLIHGRAMIEAEIDFADEDDVPGSVSDSVWSDMAALSDSVAKHIALQKRGSILRSGMRVALVGAPNAGKSTLLNALAGSDRAIVSPEPGTTRDVVEARLSLGGYLVVVADTAGIREAAGAVEQQGIERTWREAAEADLVLHLDDAAVFPKLGDRIAAPVWRVRTKRDLGGAGGGDSDFVVSARSGDGMDVLMDAIVSFAENAGGGQDLAPSRARHMDHLRLCHACLIRARNKEVALELRAEELRLASDALGRITGVVDVEDLLDRIFSSFCIGK